MASTASTFPSSAIIRLISVLSLNSTSSSSIASRLSADISSSLWSAAKMQSTFLPILLSSLQISAASSLPPSTITLSPGTSPPSSPFIPCMNVTPSNTIPASAPGIAGIRPSDAPVAITHALKPSRMISPSGYPASVPPTLQWYLISIPASISSDISSASCARSALRSGTAQRSEPPALLSRSKIVTP